MHEWKFLRSQKNIFGCVPDRAHHTGSSVMAVIIGYKNIHQMPPKPSTPGDLLVLLKRKRFGDNLGVNAGVLTTEYPILAVQTGPRLKRYDQQVVYEVPCRQWRQRFLTYGTKPNFFGRGGDWWQINLSPNIKKSK